MMIIGMIKAHPTDDRIIQGKWGQIGKAVGVAAAAGPSPYVSEAFRAAHLSGELTSIG